MSDFDDRTLAQTLTVCISFLTRSLSDDAVALALALRERMASVIIVANTEVFAVRPVIRGGDDDWHPSLETIADAIAGATRMVLLVSPGDESSDQMRYQTRLMIKRCWESESAWVAAVAPAVGAIPASLRYQPFVRYYNHDDLAISNWTSSGVPDNFLDELLRPMDRSTSGLRISTTEIKAWRDRLVHLGSGELGAEAHQRLEALLFQNLETARATLSQLPGGGDSTSSGDINALLYLAQIGLEIGSEETSQAYLSLAVSLLNRSKGYVVGTEERDRLDHSIGLLAARLGQSRLALLCLQRAVRSDESTLGQLHPATIAARQSLAQVFRSIEQVDLAERHYSRAYADAREALGDFHPLTAALAMDLGRVLVRVGQDEAARELFQRAVHAYDVVRPEDSTERRDAMDELARLGA